MTKWKTFDFSNIAIRCLRNITGKLHYCIGFMFNINCNLKTYREIDTEALVGVFAFIITWWSNNQKCSCNIKNGNQKYCCYKHWWKKVKTFRDSFRPTWQWWLKKKMTCMNPPTLTWVESNQSFLISFLL